MRKFWMVVAATLGGIIGVSGRADAWQWGHHGPWATSAAFPCINPPGWYTNTYYFAWYYPWFAYYNYSHGPYANWMAGGGYAGYASCDGRCGAMGLDGRPVLPPAPAPTQPDPDPKDPKTDPKKTDPKKDSTTARVLITLPDDARLYFNGTAAAGNGSLRSFATPPLVPGHSYAYDLTAEVVRDGRIQRVTERIVVRAGEHTRVTLNPGGLTTASLK
jgi:uncharacterized protein (TIGR03000 family)